ncbi:MAG: restriction endonuclease subunit S [Thiolinea sp.]
MSETLDYIQLSELAEISMGQSPDSSFCNSDEKGLPFLQGCAEFGRINPSSNIYCFPPLRRSKPDSLLISVRAPVGKLNWSDQEYCIGRGLGSIKAKQTTANTQFLKYAIEVGINFLYRRSQGSTFLAIGSIDLHEFPIPNFSFPQQRKIARTLQTIDRAIESTQALIEKYQLIKAGLMHDLFTRGIGADGKLRPPREAAPELYQETAIGWIPKEWYVGSLLTVTDQRRQPILTGPFGADLGQGDFVDEGIPVLRIGNVQTGYIDTTDLLFITEKKANYLNRYRISRNDLLFARQGATTGRNCLANKYIEGYLINYHIIRVALDDEKCSPVFIEAAFNSTVIMKQIERDKGRGTREGINTQQLTSLKIPMAPVSEQRDIEKILHTKQREIEAEKLRLEKLRKQKAGLMQDLLTGKVQVKVDDDESDN